MNNFEWPTYEGIELSPRLAKFLKSFGDTRDGRLKLPRNDFVIPNVEDVLLMYRKKISSSDALRTLNDSCNNSLVQKLKGFFSNYRIPKPNISPPLEYANFQSVTPLNWMLTDCYMTPMPSTISGNKLNFTYNLTLRFQERLEDGGGFYANNDSPTKTDYQTDLKVKIKGVILDYHAEGKDGYFFKKVIRNLYLELDDSLGVINHSAFQPELSMIPLSTVYSNKTAWPDASTRK
jgi:hypothetical protein